MKAIEDLENTKVWYFVDHFSEKRLASMIFKNQRENATLISWDEEYKKVTVLIQSQNYKKEEVFYLCKSAALLDRQQKNLLNAQKDVEHYQSLVDRYAKQLENERGYKQLTLDF